MTRRGGSVATATHSDERPVFRNAKNNAATRPYGNAFQFEARMTLWHKGRVLQAPHNLTGLPELADALTHLGIEGRSHLDSQSNEPSIGYLN